MYFRKERAEVICRELLNLSVVQSNEITDWFVKDGLFWSPEEADNDSVSWRKFDTKTEKWKGLDCNSWFKVSITVPESYDGKPLSLLFSTQATGWDAKNPQFLVFVNGEAECALDVNHKDVFLTKCAKAGEIYRIDLQGYTGTETCELELTAKLAQISPLVTELYYDLKVPIEIISRLNASDKRRIDLEVAVEKIVNAIDLRTPHSECFYRSIEDALVIAKEEVYTKLAGHEDIIATCVGHTHIDVAWWWTVAQTRQKVVRSFATVLKYMEDYPEYIFMSSQPQLYKYVQEHAPALYAKIKERAAEGRWEAEGGMWLEPDCNLASGESLVRQFMYGKKFFKDEFGVDSKILWLPDVFGYSAALPQIMKLCGVDYFMTTKMSWNQFNLVPYDTFIWRGIDGSEVFTHMVTTTRADNPPDTFSTTYNGYLQPCSVIGAWERYQQKEINNDVLISYGFGDGGGGPTREMIEMGKRMSKGVNGAPKVHFGNSKDYFDSLYERTIGNKELPKWVGELYLEYHRGTYTSMARNKRSNRKSELLLQDLEFVSVLAKDIPYPRKELDAMWEVILLNQFHDILPGTSIKEVYDVTKVEYAELSKEANALMTERLSAVADVSGDLAVINTLDFNRDDVIEIPGSINADALVCGDGSISVCQETNDGGKIAYVSGMPAKGVMGLKVSEKTNADNPINIDGLKIETPFYEAEFDTNGFIARLFHKESGREVLTGDVLGNELRVYEDKPMRWDNWDIDIYYTEKSWIVDETTTVKWLETGPVRATLLVERTFLESVISQKIHFYANIRRIDFETYVDWKQSQLLLKARFGTDIMSPAATYDIQFGNVSRPTHVNTSWDQARFETCAHKWADISEGGYGVSILNDCKYGHAIHDGVIALTLIKSGIEPYETTDQEEHWFTYSLLPHLGTWQTGGTVESAHCLNTPAYAVAIESPCDAAPTSYSYVSTNSSNVNIETVKKAESGDSVIIRMYEFENTRTNAVLTLRSKVAKVFETDCLENRIKEIAENTSEFTFEIKPFEIKTFELVF
ncbi:MAG: glycosyl hydrolase-related protein [Oscillospiraceae bacterium]|nr:glycosyl hydrolase-related protein [Oscillospiraceae bacterium]